MHFRFITSTPLNIVRGSGTFAGITTLAKFLRMAAHRVDLITPTFKFPVYTIERIIFNESLRFRHRRSNAVTVGFDMDGYTLAAEARDLKSRDMHVASIKGVIADEMAFESGIARATMRLQAHYEKLHVRRAQLVIAPSRYSEERIQSLYAITKPVTVVPEPIDLVEWRSLLQRNFVPPAQEKFVVLCVCRFYPRKRLDVLLAAADRLRLRIPALEIRIVGHGPEAGRLQSICRTKALNGIVKWLGNLSQEELAREYNHGHIFCLPSVQESFGIVYLEAMASGKPIVAARAASVPEVVKHGILVKPDDDEALAEGIERLYKNPELRRTVAIEASQWVKQFDGALVAGSFLRAVEYAAAPLQSR